MGMTPLSHSKSVHHIRGSMAHSLNRNHQEANHGNAGTSEHPTQILKPACRLHFILQEIGKQQPLSQGCLHSMPLSFRSLVWSSALNTLYYPDPPQNVPPPPVLPYAVVVVLAQSTPQELWSRKKIMLQAP